jgi:mRNA interferase HigB
METQGERRMHVVSRAPFDTATRQFPNQAAALDDVYRTLKTESYTSPDEMKKRFASLDRMKYREKWWVIDVGGGNLRVMFFADFERGKIFIKHITAHDEYDKLTDFYRRTKE